ncbi:S1 domain-containing RNA-binding protein [Proteinivorax tanatarense]|uniref:S1 domain-containing RNA-binding protein n=1 Tax=Proteinivorax tanatarense TaxID=1260629 RepID=A0AAU7VM91_9FIRM
MSLEAGNIVTGTVTGITNFGAFVKLPEGETGLVHISEVADTYVKDINNFLKVDQEVKVKVISVDEKGKIGLSIRQASPNPKPKEKAKPKPKKSSGPSFEDKLSKFLKDSDERQQILKRSVESKRGGRGA